jgi:hypothetical protein
MDVILHAVCEEAAQGAQRMSKRQEATKRGLGARVRLIRMEKGVVSSLVRALVWRDLGAAAALESTTFSLTASTYLFRFHLPLTTRRSL